MPYHPAPPLGALVAIATPVYNGARHLEAAIQAVQAQTYRPLVHCIVDNASTDETAEIIARYANAEIPIVATRNPSTIPFQANFNAAVALVPKEAAYFRVLHADDFMPPNAIEAMMAVARSSDGVIMVAGVEKLNGTPRAHNFPPECTLYKSCNMLARYLSDEAHIPSAHVLYRRDMVREDEEFFDTKTVECAIEAVHRVLSRGGRAGFVHEHIADTRRSKGSGSLIFSLAKTEQAVIWEKFLFIERYGPACLSNTEYARVHRRFRRVYYRRLIWWAATGRYAIARRDFLRLRERGFAPSLWNFVESAAVWPAYLYAKHIRKLHAPRPWPADAVRPEVRRA